MTPEEIGEELKFFNLSQVAPLICVSQHTLNDLRKKRKRKRGYSPTTINRCTKWLRNNPIKIA